MSNKREEMLRAAYEIVGSQGIEALHARAVAGAIGVNHALVHYYFPRRPDLLAALFDHMVERWKADRGRFLADVAPLEGEVALGEAYCRPTSRFVKVVLSLWVASLEDAELRKRFTEWMKGWLRDIDKALKRSDGTTVRRGGTVLAYLLGSALAAQTLGDDFPASKVFDEIAELLTPS